MAHQRFIKPEFFTSDTMLQCSAAERLFAIGLLTQCDREGRCVDSPVSLKVRLVPLDDIDVDAALNHLQELDFILRYEIGGKRFLQVVNWSRYQTPHHTESKSVIPPPLGQASNVSSPLVNGELTVKTPLHHRASESVSESVSESESGKVVETCLVVGGCGGKIENPDEIEPEQTAPSALKAKRRKCIPAELPYSEVFRAVTAQKRPDLAEAEALEEFDQWHAYHAAKGDAIADLTASWRTWLGNVGKWGGARPSACRGSLVTIPPLPKFHSQYITEADWKAAHLVAGVMRRSMRGEPVPVRLPGPEFTFPVLNPDGTPSDRTITAAPMLRDDGSVDWVDVSTDEYSTACLMEAPV